MTRDRNRPAVVYLVTNALNGHGYIGFTTKTADRRLKEHLYGARVRLHNGHFYRAIRKHGPEHFSVKVLRECRNVDEAIEWEINLIASMRPRYNSTLGGDGQRGRPLTEGGKAKIAAANRGNSYRLGKSHSAETRKALAQAGRKNLDIFRQYQAMGPAAQARQVVCVDDNRVFESASAAARFYNVSKSALIELCLRSPRRKSVGGLRFEYTDRSAA